MCHIVFIVNEMATSVTQQQTIISFFLYTHPLDERNGHYAISIRIHRIARKASGKEKLSKNCPINK